MATDVELILKELGEMQGRVKDQVTLGIKPTMEEQQKMAQRLSVLEDGFKDIRRERVSRIAGEGRIRVPAGRLAGYSPLELSMLRAIMLKRYENDDGRFGRPIFKEIDSAQKAIRGIVTPESLFAWEENAIKQRRAAYGFSDYNPSLRQFTDDLGAWRNQILEQVRKALDSTTTAAGDELVPTLEAAEIWLDVNLDTVILPVLQQVPMPSNPFDFPIQFADVNWYPISENLTSPTTTPATQKVSLTAYGLRAGVPFSDELEEDAIIALVPELRSSLARNAAQVIDDVLLNGDTTTTNGINSDGATIATNTAGKAHWLLGFDGIIHAALVDNSANQSSDKNTAISVNIFNSTLTKLGKYAAPIRRSDVLYVSDVNTAIAALAISSFTTLDVAGARATLSTGEIMNVFGKPYLHSSQMRLADTDGKVTDSGNATNTGRVLAFNSTQWRVGFRRQITMEAQREAGKGQTTLYTTLRIALTERSGTRSTQTHTAISYDITGVA